PEEVEEALKTLPEVVDANVVGVPDPKWGQAVTAIVELESTSQLSDEEIVEGVRRELAAYKAPKHVVRVPALLRGPNGKSDYRWAAATARSALGLPDTD
ncbi:MAG: AMP-binding enzyme, partial [Acidimicrobiales bacterium]